MSFGTLKGLDQSMNPQLMKYGRETDSSIAQARQEKRRKLFSTHAQPSKRSSTEILQPLSEQFGQRFMIKLEQLAFRLQTTLDDNTFAQAEPYFTSMALYDARAGKKITENFHFDLNEDSIRDMIQQACTTGELPSPTASISSTAINGHATNSYSINNINDTYLPKEFDSLPNEWLQRPKQAIFSINTAPHPDIYLVVKIDKILQGGIQNSTEPYLKATKESKMGLKLHKNVRAYCQYIGHFRMPFAWTCKPLFRLYSNELDDEMTFPAIYRQEINRLTDDELLKFLTDYRKPDKFSKLTVIPGILKIMVEPIKEPPNSNTPTELYFKRMLF